MQEPLLDLTSLRCFLEAARLLNFRAAARAVSLTPAALGQRIKRLEEDVGVPLFQRSTRKVVLTEAGMALVPAARDALAASRRCIAAARGEAGPLIAELTLGTRHELGESWLIPMLPNLREAFPGLTFHLYVGSGPDLDVQVRAGTADCAVSSRRLTDPALDGIPLHPERYVFAAAPSLLERVPFASPADSQHHTLIDTSADLALFGYWRDAGGLDSLRFDRLLTMGTIGYIRALVVAGQGVAVLPRYFVQPDLDAGRLVPLFPEVEPDVDWFRLLFRRDDPRRSLFEAIAEYLRGTPLA